MCGIVGIVGTTPVNQSIYDALTVLQHRGQDAAGICTIESNRFRLRKANGLVKDVFEARHMQRLQGEVGIGHVRYPTAGSSSASEAQPFYVNSPFGITLAHNGNLTNAHEVRQKLFEKIAATLTLLQIQKCCSMYWLMKLTQSKATSLQKMCSALSLTYIAPSAVHTR